MKPEQDLTLKQLINEIRIFESRAIAYFSDHPNAEEKLIQSAEEVKVLLDHFVKYNARERAENN